MGKLDRVIANQETVLGRLDDLSTRMVKTETVAAQHGLLMGAAVSAVISIFVDKFHS